MNQIKSLFKNQKGLTLVELLVVIVVLGIVSAIAVPSVGGILNNAKKDAHIANAQQMISSARLAITAEDITFSSGSATINMDKLVTDGYLEAVPEDPSGTEYIGDESLVTVTDTDGKYTFTVTLVGDEGTYISAAAPNALTRDAVKLDGTAGGS